MSDSVKLTTLYLTKA